MFIHVTSSDGEKQALVNLKQVAHIVTYNTGSCIMFDVDNYILVKESLEEIYDRIRSMSNGK